MCERVLVPWRAEARVRGTFDWRHRGHWCSVPVPAVGSASLEAQPYEQSPSARNQQRETSGILAHATSRTAFCAHPAARQPLSAAPPPRAGAKEAGRGHHDVDVPFDTARS